MCDQVNLKSKEREAKSKYQDAQKLYRSKKLELDKRLNLDTNNQSYIRIQKLIVELEETMFVMDEEINEVVEQFHKEKNIDDKEKLKERYFQINNYLHKLKDDKRTQNDDLKELRQKFDFKLTEEETDLYIEYKCDMLTAKTDWLELKSKEEELITNEEEFMINEEKDIV